MKAMIGDSDYLSRYYDIYPMYSVAFIVWRIIVLVAYATCWYLGEV